jgi:PAS domain S-box-containing protein
MDPRTSNSFWAGLRELPQKITGRWNIIESLQSRYPQLVESTRLLEIQARDLRQMLERIDEGVVVVRDSEILYANPAMAALLRAPSPGEVVGSQSSQWLDREYIEALRSWAKSEESLRTRPMKLRLRNGGAFVPVEISPPRKIAWQDREAVLWFFRDLTERRKLDHALAEARERERSSIARDLHDGLGQVLTGLAFKLKAIETALAKQGATETALLADLVDAANRATSQARDMAHGLAPVEITPQGLAPALRHLMISMGTLTGVRCEFYLVGTPPELELEVANQLYRASQESLTNAIRHGKCDQVTLTISCDSQFLSLEIRDNGAGLPPGFNPHAATGMGLRIIRHRMESIGGSFYLTNAVEGRGAVAELRLPIAHLAQTPAAPAPIPRAEPSGVASVLSRLRVLIVDDHAVARAGVAELLRQTADFTVCAEASDPAEALAACREAAPDLVLTDLLLQDKICLPLITQIRQTYPQLPVVVLTMFGTGEYRTAALAAGASGYVMKLEAPAELLAALRSATGRKSPGAEATVPISRGPNQPATEPTAP